MSEKKKILIVDDDVDVREILQLLISEEGHEAHFFSSAEEALRSLGDIRPDLVITDLMMSGVNGFDICKYLRQNMTTKDTPIIAITGYDSQQNRKKIFAIGVNDYLSKPFDLRDMRRKIRSLL